MSRKMRDPEEPNIWLKPWVIVYFVVFGVTLGYIVTALIGRFQDEQATAQPSTSKSPKPSTGGPEAPKVNERDPTPTKPDVDVTVDVVPSAEKPSKIDSAMSLEQALGKNKFPREILAQQEMVTVDYLSFDGEVHRGQIVVNRAVAGEVEQIFKELLAANFPIYKVKPIVAYGWSDSRSIMDNNTSGFNYRNVDGTNHLSDHAFGRAIDVNPKTNPYIKANGSSPRLYNKDAIGAIYSESVCTEIFKKHGWLWGGDWTNGRDLQHFYKKASN